MSPAFIVFATILVAAQLFIPRKLGFLPLIVAGCHLGNGEIIGAFTVARLLITIGLLRAVSGGFFRWSWDCKLDRVFLFFAVAAILTSAGHNYESGNPWSYHTGLAWNVCGAYLYGRAYLPDLAAFGRFARLMPLVLLPLGIAMSVEKTAHQNFYFIFGANSRSTMEREGKVRAQGPFRHPILAGCSGAVSLPLAFLLWRNSRRIMGLMGMGACLSVVLASSSSGPLAAVGITVLAAALWRYRERLYLVRWAAVVFGILFWIIKGRGPWYIMASLDLVGGSTGWHRARLMDQGWIYLKDWWLYGTDYTRHWMASGVSWSPNHVDVTNYYLHLGVIGGLPLTLSLVAMLMIAFRALGRRMREMRAAGDAEEIVIWCAGACLAAHAISFVSISYFDQMYILFYILVGSIPGLTGLAGTEVASSEPSADQPGAMGRDDESLPAKDSTLWSAFAG